MLPSPLELHLAKFLSVSIVPRNEPNIFERASDIEPFSFDGTQILTSISHALSDQDDDENRRKFLVYFDLLLPDEGDNPPPYICAIKCVGYFSIVKKITPDPIKLLDIGVVNGASMLYGMIREMIATVTSRCWYGELLLPSANFTDSKPSMMADVSAQKNNESAGDTPIPKKKTAPIKKRTSSSAKGTSKEE